jgi:FtsZ-interacting cell division protein ZipA
MVEHWIIPILFILVAIAVIILVIKKNHKDRKSLFKKLPGDYPEPKMVESEFDFKDK